MKIDLEQWDKSFLWHPFTQMADLAEEPICIIERGEGIFLVDIEGNRYMDGISSMWTNVHGHNHSELNQALTKQIAKIAHSTLLGFSNVPAIQLAKKLVEVTPPNLTHTFFSDNGSTSVEIALKIACQYWQHCGQSERTQFVHLDRSYHGDTLGAMSVGGIALFHKIFSPLTFHSISAPIPDHTQSNSLENCFNTINQIFNNHRVKIAGIIVEPLVQGAGGMIIHPAGFLKGIEQLAQKHGILLIVDEVMTGLGRTGRMWACQHEEVAPDILCTAKGLTGGYLPLAATLTTDEIYTAFLGDYAQLKTFFHGHTYTGNQLGSAVALANLKLFDQPNFFPELAEKIAYFQEHLKIFESLNCVSNLRSIGLIGAFDLLKDKQNNIEFAFEEKAGIKVCKTALKRGLILRPLVNSIILMPPLSITKNEIDQLIEILLSAVTDTFPSLVTPVPPDFK